MMNFKYRHSFLIPVVALSAAGIAACAVRSVINQGIGTDDVITSAVCLAGAATVCVGRFRAYRWVSFRDFTHDDHVCYWALLLALCVCLLVGFMRTTTPLRILAGVLYLLLSVRLRDTLIDIRRRNSYGGTSLQPYQPFKNMTK